MHGTQNHHILSFEEARTSGRTYLLEPEAKAISMKYGIPVTKFTVASTPEETLRFAEEIGYPVVLKVVSPKLFTSPMWAGSLRLTSS